MIRTKVEAKGLINAPVREVWSIIRDFNGMPNWHPYVQESELLSGHSGSEVGAIRKFIQVDGSVVCERLLALDDHKMSMTYLLLEAPIPVKNYIATISLLPITKMEKTLIEWVIDYEVEPSVGEGLNEKLHEVLCMGFDKINQMIGEKDVRIIQAMTDCF